MGPQYNAGVEHVPRRRAPLPCRARTSELRGLLIAPSSAPAPERPEEDACHDDGDAGDHHTETRRGVDPLQLYPVRPGDDRHSDKGVVGWMNGRLGAIDTGVPPGVVTLGSDDDSVAGRFNVERDLAGADDEVA